jgi:hypothetical protein
MNGLPVMLQSLFSLLIPAMVLAALVLLWRRDRSVWIIVALVGEAVGFVFRLALVVAPGIVHGAPMLMSAWTLSALVFALGLLGYAIETTSRRTP